MQALLDFLVRHVVDDPLHIGLAAETARNIAATQALFAAFGAKDIPAILEYLHPGIVIEFYGPSVIPYAGISSRRSSPRSTFTSSTPRNSSQNATR